MSIQFNADRHEILIQVNDWDLRELGKHLPAAHWRKNYATWAVPASYFTAKRVADTYGMLHQDGSFANYLAEAEQCLWVAQEMAKAKEWAPIPITAIQPKGEWMHQRRAFWFSYHLDSSVLAVTMGGGKTKTAIDLLQNWKSSRVLVITPNAAQEDVWFPQLDQYMVNEYLASFRFQHTDLKRFTADADYLMTNGGAPHNLVVVNWEAFWREPFRSWAVAQKWDAVIPDEAHRAKSAGSFQSKFLFQLGLRSRRKLCLTGTLMPHSPLDVYGTYRFADHGIFGTNHDKFEARYAEKGGYHDREVVGFKNTEELTEKFVPITLIVDDSEQGLPRTVDIEHKVDLEPPAKKAYFEVDKEFITQVKGGTITAKNSGVKLLRLHQLACGIAKTDESDKERRMSDAKIRAVKEILRDLRDDEPIVIFTRFRLDMNDLQIALNKAGHTVSLIGNGVNELQHWKRGQTQVLIAQIQAVKEGVDLTRSAVGIFYSTGIYLGDYLQCRKRLHRPPQKRMVRFIHILARGTKDVVTMRALRERRDVIATVLADAKNR